MPDNGPYVAELRDLRAGLTATQQAAIIHAYQQRGASLASVGRAHHVSVTTVANVLDRAGIPRRPAGGSRPTLTTEALLEAGELHARGLTQAQIAAIQGVARTTVSYRLQRLGAQRRPRTEAARIAAQTRARNAGRTMRQLTTDGHEVDLRRNEHGEWVA